LAAGDDKPFSFVAYGDSADGEALGFRKVQARINQLDPNRRAAGDNIYSLGTHKEADSRSTRRSIPTAAWMPGIDYLGLETTMLAVVGPSQRAVAPIPIEGHGSCQLPASERRA
jgi:hypothetical protein